LSLEATLIDTDNVRGEKPYRIYIVSVEDEPPTVNVRLQGIGTVVTPDVVINVQGRIEDDYQVASSAFEVMVNDGDPRSQPFELQSGGTVDASIDFREQRSEDSGFSLQPNDRLSLTVVATDKFDLDSNVVGEVGNIGSGDHYQLEVVTPDKLLSILEARELGLRRRFEQIRNEVTELRQSLVRVKNEGPAAVDASSADETESESEEPNAASNRIWSLRLLRTQRAQLQSEKSAQETLGVAASFGDIRAELINNRVDTEDRKQRIQEQVVVPLQAIGDTMFPELDRQLIALGERLDDRQQEELDPHTEDLASVSLASTTIKQADDILLAIDDVLQNMLDIEDFNELLDRVRDLIAEQEGLLDNTKKAQKQQVLDLIQ
jgi:hypothetical protein